MRDNRAVRACKSQLATSVRGQLCLPVDRPRYGFGVVDPVPVPVPLPVPVVPEVPVPRAPVLDPVRLPVLVPVPDPVPEAAPASAPRPRSPVLPAGEEAPVFRPAQPVLIRADVPNAASVPARVSIRMCFIFTRLCSLSTAL